MHALRVFLPVALILAIAGCAGMNAPTQQNSLPAASQVPELLYVGTSNPGLLTYQIRPDGALQAAPTSSAVPPLCRPTLEPVPGRIYVISVSCSDPTGPLEFRRLDLDSTGNIASATGPLFLGPDFPSTDGVTNFLPADTGKFAYTRSLGSDSQEHISVVQIGAAGDLTLKPGLGLSWPIVANGSCGESHLPSSVVTTPEGSFLIVQDTFFCHGMEPNVNYFVFQVDSDTGAVGKLVAKVALGDVPSIPFIIKNGALMIVAELGDGVHGDLRLFHLGLDGVTLLQLCSAGQPACAHPNNAAFHPSGKRIFVTDENAGGIWTIPVTGSSLSADKASFLPADIVLAGGLTFSSDGSSVYLAQLHLPEEKPQILGFRVNDSTGVLAPIPGSPWRPENIDLITAMTVVVGTGR